MLENNFPSCRMVQFNKNFIAYDLLSTEPLKGHGKIKIAPCIKSCAQDDLVIIRKQVTIMSRDNKIIS